MTSVLLEPHHDDAVLFACYMMLRLHPTLVTVFGNARAQERYGISYMARDNENIEAMRVLEPEAWLCWDNSDIEPDPERIEDDMRRLNNRLEPVQVYAPMFEEHGHEQHNLVNTIAVRVFRQVREYATYKRGSGRTHTEHEVLPEPGWPAIKMRAMSCYVSQINLENCQPWFAAHDMLREWEA